MIVRDGIYKRNLIEVALPKFFGRPAERFFLFGIIQGQIEGNIMFEIHKYLEKIYMRIDRKNKLISIPRRVEELTGGG